MNENPELLLDEIEPEALEGMLVRLISERAGIKVEWLAQLTQLKGAARESVMEVCIDLLEELRCGGIRSTLYKVLCAPGIERFSYRLAQLFRIEQFPETFEPLQLTMLLAFAKKNAEVALLFLERPRILNDSALRFLIRFAQANDEIKNSLWRHFERHEFDLEILLAISRNWPEEYDFLAQVDNNPSKRLSAACCTALLDFQVPHEQWYCRRANVVPFYATVLLRAQIAPIEIMQHASILASEHKMQMDLGITSATLNIHLGDKCCILLGSCESIEANGLKALIVRRCDGQLTNTSKRHKHPVRVLPKQQSSISPPERVEVVLIQCPNSQEWNQLPKVLLPEDHPIRKLLEARLRRS
jgi:hypothetical protein